MVSQFSLMMWIRGGHGSGALVVLAPSLPTMTAVTSLTVISPFMLVSTGLLLVVVICFLETSLFPPPCMWGILQKLGQVQILGPRDLIFWSFAYCLTISESSCQNQQI